MTSWSAAVSTASTASTDHLASSPTPVGPDEIKISPACYLEMRDGWEFCTLCKRYATQGHLESENHKYRVEMTEWESQWKGELDENGVYCEGPPKWWGNPKFFEWKDGWRWWCRICHQWADGGHVQGNRHAKRVEWFDWYPEELEHLVDDSDDRGERRESSATGNQESPVLDPWGKEWEAEPRTSNWYEAWSEEYKRPYYYNVVTMAQSWEMPPEGLAATSHIDASQNAAGKSQRKAAEHVPAPWQKEWSEEHKQHFYWNTKTNESRWQLPDWADEWC